jgi:SAM-dependent methyltransferase
MEWLKPQRWQQAVRSVPGIRESTVFQVARLGYRTLAPFIQPWQAAAAIAAVPWFIRTRIEYGRMSREVIPLVDTTPMLTDRTQAAGGGDSQYFYQDWWAARKVYESGRKDHVDVGSRIDGFVAHCATFATVTFVDIRPFESEIPTIRSAIGTLLALPFDDRSVVSLSCLHVAEHVGLGRYGDPLDPDGTIKAIRELQRVLAPGGNLYFGIPIGRERVCFNAHRILSPHTILAGFNELSLESFAAIDDRGRFIDPAKPEDFVNAEYSCGLFHFTRPAG